MQTNNNGYISSKTVVFEGTHNGQEIIAKIVVHQATVRDSTYKMWMQVDAQAHTKDDDPQTSFLRFRTFPDMLCVSSGEISIDSNLLDWPITFDQFLDLPERLGIDWERAVYELNPHWRFSQIEDDEEKKVKARSGKE